jgi:hypothetical protein
MAFRYLTMALLLASTALAGDPFWSYLPVNSEDLNTGKSTDGIALYFNDPGASQIEVTVEATCNGKPVSVTETVDPDRAPVVHILIDAKHRHELTRISMRIGNSVLTWGHPKAGVHYGWHT